VGCKDIAENLGWFLNDNRFWIECQSGIANHSKEFGLDVVKGIEAMEQRCGNLIFKNNREKTLELDGVSPSYDLSQYKTESFYFDLRERSA
jgi:hypothetical protein